jgi:3'-phosphoadenosine 5'-phosphosulfate sulfotransferase (PAPS reductase)/FAD synthetase
LIKPVIFSLNFGVKKRPTDVLVTGRRRPESKTTTGARGLATEAEADRARPLLAWVTEETKAPPHEADWRSSGSGPSS